jgi:hypothetical protein
MDGYDEQYGDEYRNYDSDPVLAVVTVQFTPKINSDAYERIQTKHNKHAIYQIMSQVLPVIFDDDLTPSADLVD